LQILSRLPFLAIAFFAPMETWAAIAGVWNERRRCSKWKLNVKRALFATGWSGPSRPASSAETCGLQAPEVFRAGTDQKYLSAEADNPHSWPNAGLKALLHGPCFALTNHGGHFRGFHVLLFPITFTPI